MSLQRKVPVRTCVSCRTSSDKRNLVRVVRTGDGDVRLDPGGKAPGRGAYLCGAKECIALALKANKLGRALRCEIPERFRIELESMALNAGEVSMTTPKQRGRDGKIDMQTGNTDMKAE